MKKPRLGVWKYPDDRKFRLPWRLPKECACIEDHMHGKVLVIRGGIKVLECFADFLAVRTEAVYQEGLWFHTACHRAGADQLLRATRLSEVLKEVKRGVEILTSPLLQGDEPPV
jgi:hypothetical protein